MAGIWDLLGGGGSSDGTGLLAQLLGGQAGNRLTQTATDQTQGGAGLLGHLGSWVKSNPAAIDAVATGFANIGNKNVGNPFLYGAGQAADEFKDQKKMQEAEQNKQLMTSALRKLGYPDEMIGVAAGNPEIGGTLINSYYKALLPKEPKAAEARQFYDEKTGQKYVAQWSPSGGWQRVGGAASDLMSRKKFQQQMDLQRRYP